jgi:hypothetical protein
MGETYGGNITVVPGAREFSFHASGTLSEGHLVDIAENVDPSTGDYTVKLADANSESVLGYVDTEWDDDDMCVVYTGPAIARLYAAEAISIGDVVGPATTGHIVKYVGRVGAAVSGCVVGVALENIAASAWGKVFVNISPNPLPGGHAVS